MDQARSEAATPRRLALARARGYVAVSPELSACVGLVGAFGALSQLSASTFAGLQSSLGAALSCVADPGASWAPLIDALRALARTLLLLLCIPALVGVFAGFLQAGPLVAPVRLQPAARRFDPLTRLLGLCAPTQLLQAAWSLLRAAALLAALAYVGVGIIRAVLSASMASERLALSTLGHASLELGLRVGALGVLLSVLDLAYRRLVLRVQLRMTRREVDEEVKESYGAPELRERRRRLRREIAAQAELSALRSASVLLLDGHSQALALGFQREDASMAAPRVVAKAQGALCTRMQLVAAQYGIPERVDAWLVRGLFALEINEQVPRGVYDRVASVLRDAEAASKSTAP